MKKQKNEKQRLFRIERAKRTAFGRVLCRLFGEQTGAVMMEYVVLGVLVVAAVVGIVCVFSDTVREGINTMIQAIVNPRKVKDAAGAMQDAGNNTTDAIEAHQVITGGGTSGNSEDNNP